MHEPLFLRVVERLQCLAKDIMIQPVAIATLILDLVQLCCRGQGRAHVLLGCRCIANKGNETRVFILLLLFFARRPM
eukprot:4465777-Prorocentrum_lima.AAC.1